MYCPGNTSHEISDLVKFGGGGHGICDVTGSVYWFLGTLSVKPNYDGFLCVSPTCDMTDRSKSENPDRSLRIYQE
jgi:hypothetical protein